VKPLSLDDPQAFIREHTDVLTPPLVPEIKLHLATETVDIWEQTEEALGEMGLPPPFWAFAWAGGQALARYCLDNPDIVKGKRVLDFAAGGAVSGIAAKMSGAEQVTASELDAFAIEACRANATLNAVELDTELGDVVGRFDAWDMIIAGDVFYEDEGARHIGAWLEESARRGTRVLIGDPGRSFLPREKLDRLAEYTVPVTRDLEDREVRYAKVWSFNTP